MSDPAGTQVDHPARGEVVHGWATVPNAITLARLVVFVPLVVWLVLGTDARLAATVALVVFGATDWVDGFLARRTHTVSDVGIWLDPVADRLGILIILVTMTVAGLVPWWVLVLIVVTDVVVLLAGLRFRSRIGRMRASWAGKVRTALIMVAMPAALLGDAAIWGAGAFTLVGLVAFAAGAVLHVLAGTGYVLRLAGRLEADPDAGTAIF
ncbi:CDP-alcohol phosphatidyltransferase family protein [Desertihabitans aurantiacus]|uniref:CDP-alcohol phosphatidyltransferase family protein n=1 Tax=Desertihabitans aurantiacus TaxID=2282477 RepID=UPI000DF84D3E|nr:CDP-alcohol phosphatidyltransferase family protein [Desertihabitans aurantiacus]